MKEHAQSEAGKKKREKISVSFSISAFNKIFLTLLEFIVTCFSAPFFCTIFRTIVFFVTNSEQLVCMWFLSIFCMYMHFIWGKCGLFSIFFLVLVKIRKYPGFFENPSVLFECKCRDEDFGQIFFFKKKGFEIWFTIFYMSLIDAVVFGNTVFYRCDL